MLKEKFFQIGVGHFSLQPVIILTSNLRNVSTLTAKSCRFVLTTSAFYFEVFGVLWSK